jgi:coenzyme F420-reducing hydrogenase delta subunit
VTLGRTLRMLRVACAARGDRHAVLEALDREFDAALAAADRAGVTKAELSAIEVAARSPG